MNDVK